MQFVNKDQFEQVIKQRRWQEAAMLGPAKRVAAASLSWEVPRYYSLDDPLKLADLAAQPKPMKSVVGRLALRAGGCRHV